MEKFTAFQILSIYC